MCIILIGQPTKEQHNLAKLQNKDGFSLFTKSMGLIKSPTEEQVKKAHKEFGIYHYRIATSGRVDDYNIHPFPVCNNQYYLYHNGVLGPGKDDMSDTHALSKLLQYVSLETAKTILTSLTDSGRFVLVNVEDPTDFYIYGKWVAEAGVLMSHKMYAPYTTTKYIPPKNKPVKGGSKKDKTIEYVNPNNFTTMIE